MAFDDEDEELVRSSRKLYVSCIRGGIYSFLKMKYKATSSEQSEIEYLIPLQQEMRLAAKARHQQDTPVTANGGPFPNVALLVESNTRSRHQPHKNSGQEAILVA